MTFSYSHKHYTCVENCLSESNYEQNRPEYLLEVVPSLCMSKSQLENYVKSNSSYTEFELSTSDIAASSLWTLSQAAAH